jgi:hypothetical protein
MNRCFTLLFKLIKKRCICNYMSITPPNFFVKFTNAKSKWPPLLQCFYDFNSKKLGFDVPFKKLEITNIINLV